MDVLQKACSLTCCASEANSTLEAAALKPCLPLPFLGLDSYASPLIPRPLYPTTTTTTLPEQTQPSQI